MYSQITTAPPIPETTREPFIQEQIDALWKIKDEPWVNTVLIYIYTGFRLQELLGMKTEQVNIKEWYFEGGIKTAAGKCRIVPIHERIRPFVKALVDEGNKYLFTCQGKKFSQANYYKCWGEVMEKINEISKIVGYDNQLYFSRLFHKLKGYSPREYQKIRNKF